MMRSKLDLFGAWLSLARAPGSGPGGRWFESTRPDQSPLSFLYLLQTVGAHSVNLGDLLVRVAFLRYAQKYAHPIPSGHVPLLRELCGLAGERTVWSWRNRYA